MFEFLHEKKPEAETEQDAIQKLLDCFSELDNILYNEKMANVDRERAETYKTFFSSMLEDCDGNAEKEKAFKDVISACIILEEKQNPENSELLDTKLEYAEKYI